MKQPEKKKLCWNCEGSAPLQDENCPYCGVYLSPLSLSGRQGDLFDPPYRLGNRNDQEQVPAPPYAISPAEEQKKAEPSVLAMDAAEEESSEKTVIQEALLPLILLLSGSAFMLFGLALLLFSRHGVLTLHWNGSYWPFYLVVSLPMLVFGWRSLQQLSEGDR